MSQLFIKNNQMFKIVDQLSYHTINHKDFKGDMNFMWYYFDRFWQIKLLAFPVIISANGETCIICQV